VSPCSIDRRELAEVALGASASKRLSTHLQQCSACAAELERQRALVQRMDVAVKALAGSQPPPRLLASITARARCDERPRQWSRAWPRAIAGAAFAASLGGLIFGLRTLETPATSGSDAVSLTAWRSPTATLLKPRGSILDAPLRDVWFDLESRPSRSQPTPGGTV